PRARRRCVPRTTRCSWSSLGQLALRGPCDRPVLLSDDELDQAPQRQVGYEEEDQRDDHEQQGGLGRLHDLLAGRPGDPAELGARVAEVLREALEHGLRPSPLCGPCAGGPTGSTCAARACPGCCAGSCASRSCGACTRCTRGAV